MGTAAKSICPIGHHIQVTQSYTEQDQHRSWKSLYTGFIWKREKKSNSLESCPALYTGNVIILQKIKFYPMAVISHTLSDKLTKKNWIKITHTKYIITHITINSMTTHSQHSRKHRTRLLWTIAYYAEITSF